jgi:hypothetical protein
MSLSAASAASARQALIGFSSTRTVHAPHMPIPQPSRGSGGDRQGYERD